MKAMGATVLHMNDTISKSIKACSDSRDSIQWTQSSNSSSTHCYYSQINQSINLTSSRDETKGGNQEEAHRRKWCSWSDSKGRRSERRRITKAERGSKSSASDGFDSSMCETSLHILSPRFLFFLIVLHYEEEEEAERIPTQISEIPLLD